MHLSSTRTRATRITRRSEALFLLALSVGCRLDAITIRNDGSATDTSESDDGASSGSSDSATASTSSAPDSSSGSTMGLGTDGGTEATSDASSETTSTDTLSGGTETGTETGLSEDGSSTSTSTSTSTTSGGTSTTGTDGSTDAGSSDDGGMARACDYSVGCHDVGSWQNAAVGHNSLAPVGCEGEVFSATASFDIGSPLLGGGREAHRVHPVLADFTGDGVLDVAINPRKSVPQIVPGDGTGDFPYGMDDIILLPSSSPFSSGWGVDAGDIDGDGDIDLAAGDHGWSAATWFNIDGEMFNEIQDDLRDDDGCSGVGCGTNHNGAGLADLYGGSGLEIILGGDQFSPDHVDMASFSTASSTWTKHTSPPAIDRAAGHIVFADLEGDGDYDVIAFAKGETRAIEAQVFTNSSGSMTLLGKFLGDNTTVRSGPRQGSVGDVNCDGFPDLAVGGRIYFGDGSDFTAGPEVDDSTFAHFADMNGDGALDLVTHSAARGVAMYYNAGNGLTWDREYDGLPDETYRSRSATADEVYGLDIGDLDGNGNLDVVRIAGFADYWVFEAWTR